MEEIALRLRDLGKTCLLTTTTRLAAPGAGRTLWLFDDMDGFHHCIAGGLPQSATAGREIKAGKLIGLPPDLIAQIAESAYFDYILVEADGSRGKPLKGYESHEPVVPACTSHTIVLAGMSALGAPLDEEQVHRAGLLSERLRAPLGAQITEEMILQALVHPRGYLSAARGAVTVVLNQVDTPQGAAASRRIAEGLRAQRNRTIHHLFLRGIQGWEVIW
jgi:probable selenium-dependent hydroxylase accessory protein YqeC